MEQALSRSPEASLDKWSRRQPAVRVRAGDVRTTVRMSHEDVARVEALQEKLTSDAKGWPPRYSLVVRRALSVYMQHCAQHLDQERHVLVNLGKVLKKSKKREEIVPTTEPSKATAEGQPALHAGDF